MAAKQRVRASSEGSGQRLPNPPGRRSGDSCYLHRSPHAPLLGSSGGSKEEPPDGCGAGGDSERTDLPDGVLYVMAFEYIRWNKLCLDNSCHLLLQTFLNVANKAFQ